jgi:hypothetical protein
MLSEVVICLPSPLGCILNSNQLNHQVSGNVEQVESIGVERQEENQK